MILQAHQMLCQEPWCFHPEQIATLTDWQIEHLYARPAVERAKKLESQREDHHMREPQTAEHPDPNSPEFRGWVIKQFMTMGMTYEAAEKQYEDQAKQG